MNGVINVNKPEGWTSQDVCAKLRSRLHIKKIGHTGTLDPMATGVLPVCMGKATRIIEYYDADYKSYQAKMKLGITTDTLDITGEVLETASYADVTEKAVREAFAAYTGTVKQVPPKYSALKVDGKRAYELAREGKDFELPVREIEIVSNEIIGINLEPDESPNSSHKEFRGSSHEEYQGSDHTKFRGSAYGGSQGNSHTDPASLNTELGIIEFSVTCSKGTYIRTMIDDIGRTLGCGAVMTSLVRTGSGYFRIEDAYELSDLIEMSDEELEKCVIPMDETLINLGKVLLDDNRVTAFINGNTSSQGCYKVSEPSNFNNKGSNDVSSCSSKDTNSNSFFNSKDTQGNSHINYKDTQDHSSSAGFYRVYSRTDNKFLGVGCITNGELRPSKVIEVSNLVKTRRNAMK